MTDRRGMLLEATIGGLVCVALGLPSLAFPMGTDQATLGVWAQQLARGLVPYRDVFDQRPPLLHLLHALGWAAGLHAMSLTRVVDLAIQVCSAAALGALGSAWFGRGAGALAGTLYGFCYFGQSDFHNMSQPDGLVGLPIALALLCLERSRGRRAYVVAGTLLGLSVLAKYPAVLAAPVLVAAMTAARLTERARGAAWMALGSLLPAAVLIGALSAAGAFPAFVLDTVTFNLSHQAIGAEDPRLLAQVHEFAIQLLLRREVVAPLLLLPLARLERRPLGLALGWLASTVAMVVAQRKFFSYHFLAMVAPLALLSAAAVRGVWSRLRNERAPGLQRATWAAALLLACAAGFRTARDYALATRWTLESLAGEPAREAFWARHTHPLGYWSLADDFVAARFIADRANPGDRLFALGSPRVYYLSGLRPASRFILSSAFLARGHPRAYDRELARELSEHPPRFVVLYRKDRVPAVTGYRASSQELLALQPALEGLLRPARLVLTLDTLLLYELAGGGSVF